MQQRNYQHDTPNKVKSSTPFTLQFESNGLKSAYILLVYPHPRAKGNFFSGVIYVTIAQK